MKQIKTIISNCIDIMLPPGKMTPVYEFDTAVNNAIKDGWTLIRRGTITGRFVAELEREEDITEEGLYSEWKTTRDPHHPYRCANCGLKAIHPHEICPDCGAVMVGAE